MGTRGPRWHFPIPAWHCPTITRAGSVPRPAQPYKATTNPRGQNPERTGPRELPESQAQPCPACPELLSEVPMVASASPRPLAQPYHYVLRDSEQKGLCLRDGHLVATSLQGANAAQEEPISVVPNRHLERRRCPLIVGIRGGTRALSCGTGPEPRLHLEDVGLLELFSQEGDEARPFTFYKTFGGSTHTFEAAAFPGLFLSTAPGPGEALAMAPPHGATAFYLRRK
ncbi:interleukin-36 receptor antagonist protein-like isoform X2 [Myiozetetes cayanensis]|uniref:interleukin-36 receptor antagonist protein-like isoform X2 n=1 Tax=Myiozetetes cayanensis TaxID=478635 RepID=UPI0021605076|nr:interleukin-36 receptor antagonist protein-like isoform X2 [Myiozetetes cayanensis]